MRRYYYSKEHRLPKKIVDQIEVAIQGVRDWAQRTTNMMYSSYGRVRSIYKTKDKEERRRNQEPNRMKTLHISAKLG